MKKLILIALASLSIIACRKDDDNEKSEPLIVGTWKTTDYIAISGKDGSIIFSNTIPETDCIRKSKYTYKTNGKFVAEYFLNIQTGQCGNVGFPEEMDYIYNESAKTISYKIDGITQDLINVYSLSKTEMQILVSDNMDQNSDGIPDRILKIYIKQ
ncbi:lipocalin family protein [Epilithonimonas sp. UC225_85]|uniref:lipocalin family protein n=1 Tax=Epilithonimonas sp. UC225_85 TaxID=3350167 RepID=UPI0036D212E3